MKINVSYRMMTRNLVAAAFGCAWLTAQPLHALQQVGVYFTPSDNPAVQVNGNWVYLAQDRQIYIVDASSFGNLRLVNTFTVSGDVGVHGLVDIAFANNHVYAWSSNERLIIVDVSNPNAPVQRSNTAHGDVILRYGQQVRVDGNRVYGATKIGAGQGVAIVDVANPSSPRKLASIDTMANLAVPIGNRLYVGHGNGDGLLVYDISNVSSPRLLGSSRFGFSSLTINGIQQVGSYLVLATSQGILSVNANDPLNMQRRDYVSGERTRMVAIGGASIAATHWGNGIAVYQVTANGLLHRVHSQNCGTRKLAYGNGYIYGINKPLGQPTALRIYARSWDEGYQDIGGGWRRLAWFGDYVPMGSAGWIWHNQHGFFFVAGIAQPGSTWLFSRDMGWLWTGNATYPCLYRQNDRAWLWYNGMKNPRWFWNLSAGRWESRP